MNDIQKSVIGALTKLHEAARLKPGALVVVGCSTSEISGEKIGKSPRPELGEEIARALLDAADKLDINIAVQCCEHLNRALVVKRSVAEKYNYETVSAVPHPAAGGSCASAYYRAIENPVLAESISADAGIDIGDTFIGMHLRRVAVPVRADFDKIGQAHLTMAYSRPRLIGGERARYSL